jgi:dinuclear metal center YbgI/SA1388 family protein
MLVADLVRTMDVIAPTRLAAQWDNVGLIVGDPRCDVSRVLLAIDCTHPVLAEAAREGYGAVVAYHPPIFDAQKRFVAGSIAYEAARAQVAIYSPHTALDVVDGGTNDLLADLLGMTHRAPLRPIEFASSPPRGFGRVGPVPPTSVRALVERVKQGLRVAHVLVAGSMDRQVTRAAVCAGSGGDLLGEAIEAQAELLLTGELRHHDVLRALAAGVVVVCALHSASERLALTSLRRMLTEQLPGVEVASSREDREPFAVE